MTIVAPLGQFNDPTGAQTIAASEPGTAGVLPAAETPPLPAAELGPQAAQATDAGAGGAPLSASPGAPKPVISNGGSSLRNKIIALGMQYIGTPYVWGGTQPGGFDCSGLMQYIYGKNGIKLPRISYQQANFGHRIGLNALRPGDLVAWDDSSRNAGADHVALYIGHGQILEAPHTGADVRVRSLSPGKGFDASAWGVSLNLPGD